MQRGERLNGREAVLLRGIRILEPIPALVAHLIVVFGVAALRLPDRALDHVLGHVLGPRRDDGGAEPRIERRIGLAELGGRGDFSGELAEQLGARLILAPLAVHDVLELRMTGHNPLCDARFIRVIKRGRDGSH